MSLERQPPASALERSYAVAQEVAAKDANNLYVTSQYFTDAEKFRAFCAFYSVMRIVDDRIDAIPSRAALSSEQRHAEHAAVRFWESVVSDLLTGEGRSPTSCPPGYEPIALDLLPSFQASARLFPHPQALWTNFFAAMRRDIDRPRFETYDEFLDYAEGAAVAPTTIYLFLIASRREGESYRVSEGFDLRECGRQLGLFAYLGHILRDLAKDLDAGEEGLLYFGADDMARFGVTETLLRADAAQRRAGPELRALVAELSSRARGHLDSTRGALEALSEQVDPDCEFILALIVHLYQEILDRLAACGFDPLSGEHEVGAAERWQLIMKLKSARSRRARLRREGAAPA